MSRRQALEQRWRAQSLWVVPMMCIAVGAVAVAVTLAIDAVVGYDLLPQSVLGTPSAAQTVLSTAASAMLTLTTIVLTVMTLGVQLAMQQFSPRIVRALLADRRSQLAHGLFAATFLFCMVAVAKDQRPGDARSTGAERHRRARLPAAARQPLALVLYVHHAGQSLRVAGLIDLVGDNLHGRSTGCSRRNVGPRPHERTVTAPDAGVVVHDATSTALIEQARRADGWLEMLVAVGDFVPRDSALARWHGDVLPDHRALRRRVQLDNERSHVGDAAYDLRKLVDIAERSIASSPYDDPVTAVQAIDRIHDGVRQLSFRRMPTGRHLDVDGVLRVTTREIAWQGYVVIAFQELVAVGAASPVVARRLLAALDDLVAVAPDERRPALEEQRERLVASADRTTIDLVPDVQGIGTGADLRQPS